MPYIANTDEDRNEMLKETGCNTVQELWKKAGISFPAPDLSKLSSGKSELEVKKYLQALASQNATDLINFMGAGYYEHFIPDVIGSITSRSEFYTAYTPYQPEASQGTLQAIYEWQSSICRLTGMEVSNASMYDGGTALFEAMMLAVKSTRRKKVIISGAVSPIFREMIRCYSSNLEIELVEIASSEADSNQSAIIAAIDKETACVLVQYPNVFGTVEDWEEIIEKIHSVRGLAVCSTYPIALALIKTPGEMGFDIVTGEGQSLGLSLNFGGPYLGFMCVTKKLMRKIPGRVCGKTVDSEGRDGFVLTLQAREQHIRRDGAMSNICSNENLCALAALVYMNTMGKEGLIEVAELCASKAVFAKDELLKIDGVKLVGKGEFFNEFVIELPCENALSVVGSMINKGFVAGFPLGKYYIGRNNQLLVAVTETRTKEDIKAFANALEAVLKQ